MSNLPPVPPVKALLKGKQHEFTLGTPGEKASKHKYRGYRGVKECLLEP